MFPLKVLPQIFKAISILIAILSIVLFINFWITLRPEWVSFDGASYSWRMATVNAAVNASIQFGASIIACFVLYGLGQLVDVILFIQRAFIEIKARRERRQAAPAPRPAMHATHIPLVPEPTRTDTQEREAAETAMLYERARQYQSSPPAAPDMSAYRPKRRWTPDIDKR
jgi:hypothetical protein